MNIYYEVLYTVMHFLKSLVSSKFRQNLLGGGVLRSPKSYSLIIREEYVLSVILVWLALQSRYFPAAAPRIPLWFSWYRDAGIQLAAILSPNYFA